MSSNTRIFPRYQTEAMKIQFIAPTMKNKEFVVENVSLGGIKVSSKTPTKFDPNLKINLKLGSQEFELNVFTVWNQTASSDDDNLFSYGFRLVFSQEDNYRRWMTFMKALHQHQKNLKTKNS